MVGAIAAPGYLQGGKSPIVPTERRINDVIFYQPVVPMEQNNYRYNEYQDF